MLVLVLALVLQSSQAVALKRLEVLRVNPADIERLPASLRPIFVDPTPDAEPVDSLEAATSRAGFTPRLPSSGNKPQLGVIDPLRGQVTIGIADLNGALRDAKATNVAAPQEWEGVTIA